ncbi:MAG: FprA family A-type flavoprotein [Myxococcota bacterium]
MESPFKALKVTDRVWWVGACDWMLREFHGYSTQRGTTYNAFLILDKKVTLIDAVKAHFKDELLGRIASVIDPKEIAYIVSNHSEMDHSGCLPEIVAIVQPEKVFASKTGKQTLIEHFHFSGDFIEPVKTGDSLSLGENTLKFIDAKMLHWPESMVSLLEEERILFSQDMFGMHLAQNKLFADLIHQDILDYEAAKYYANILLPFSSVVAKFLDTLEAMNLKFKIIAPDHGPLWRKNPENIIALYRKWASQKPSKKILIVYDTMWFSTDKMARAVSDGVAHGGAEPVLLPLKSNQRADIAVELLDAGGLIVGSPTINNELYPTVADILSYLKGLRRKNLIGASFGSYGWSGEAVKDVTTKLSEMGVEVIGETRAKYVPTEAVLKECFELGERVAERVLAGCGY